MSTVITLACVHCCLPKRILVKLLDLLLKIKVYDISEHLITKSHIYAEMCEIGATGWWDLIRERPFHTVGRNWTINEGLFFGQRRGLNFFRSDVKEEGLFHVSLANIFNICNKRVVNQIFPTPSQQLEKKLFWSPHYLRKCDLFHPFPSAITFWIQF